MKKIISVFFPDRCPVCAKAVGSLEKGIHARCREKLSYITGACCIRCGRPLFDERKGRCDNCEHTQYAYEAGKSVWLYDETMQRLIYDLKYGGCREYGEFLGEEMTRLFAETIKEWKIDRIVPVPIHPNRMKERGYNQAEIPARVLAERLGISLDTGLLRRTKKTQAQKELDKRERMRNLSGAFCCTAALKNRERILLIDDIYTTGSTMHACALSLRRAGAEAVFFLTAACGGED